MEGRNTRKSPVISTDEEGKEIRYETMKAAADAIGVRPARISQACVLGCRCMGFYWRKADED